MKLTDILARLDGVESDHDGYTAFCKAHNDRQHQSLKLTLKDDGKLLVVCRSGCSPADILKSLDLTASDLFDVDGQGAKTIPSAAPESVGIAEIAGLRHLITITSAWLPDVDEAVQYLADRFGLTAEAAQDLGVGYWADTIEFTAPWLSGSFRRYPRLTVPLMGFDGVAKGLQGRDLSGKCPARWVSLSNTQGRTWSKYGVMRSGAGYDTILICEGPGDALTAVGAGYDAVAIRGAGLARNAALVAELAEGLGTSDVVLCGDRDRAGAGFTDSLAGALVRAGVMVRRLEIPNDGDDLTDWRARNSEGFPAALHAAVRAAEVVVLDAPAAAVAAPTVDPSVLPEMPASARQMFDGTDVGIAVMLRDYMEAHGTGVRYAKGLGYLVWDGSIWTSGDATVRESLHRMGAELLASGEDAKRHLALKALTNRSIDAVLKELPSAPGVPVDAQGFDADQYLLSVANGTIDLRTGQLKPHDPADLITRRLEVAYRPEATAPRWEQFLREVFPGHPELPAFIRRLIGYGITGSTSEQLFVIHHGGGKNGKTVYTSTLSHVFKGVVTSSEFTVFEKTPEEGQASPGLARLRGYRLVLAAESEKYARLAEPLVKRLTGNGNVLTVRFLHANPFSYIPQFLLQVETNYKPAIMSSDYGIWRRVKLIPWEAVFDGSAQDPDLQSKLRGEAEGILNWAVQGAVEWYAHGLGEPESVRSSTAEYKESEDRLSEWLEACLIPDPEARVAPMQLRRAYAEWCEDAGMSKKEQLSGWSLGIEIESRGFPKKKAGGRWGFQGIRLKTDAEKSAQQQSETTSPADEPTDIFGQVREETAA